MNEEHGRHAAGTPEAVFSWRDPEGTGAVGWVVLDRVVNQVAGGGIFMHAQASLQEVADVARNMSRKFTVTEPQIGGAKAGIRFDHEDPRKDDVLRRFLIDHAFLLRSIWVTAGDLNTSDAFIERVIRGELGLPTSQAALAARLAQVPGERDRAAQLAALMLVPASRFFTLVEAAVGYGLAESIAFVTRQLRTRPRVAIQGAGTVGTSAAYYLAQRGIADIVAWADASGWLARPAGLPIESLLDLRLQRATHGTPRAKELSVHVAEEDAEQLGLTVVRRDMHTTSDLCEFLSTVEAEVFSPCATRYQVTPEVVRCLDRSTWRSQSRFLVSGANNPLGQETSTLLGEDRSGAVLRELEQSGAVTVPDWVANSGTAQFFHLALRHDFPLGNVQAVVADMLGRVRARIHSYLTEAERLAPGSLVAGCETLARQRLAAPELLAYEGLTA